MLKSLCSQHDEHAALASMASFWGFGNLQTRSVNRPGSEPETLNPKSKILKASDSKPSKIV